ncbi:GNAT family N-acetyltransferase [Salinispora arenicola]|uniref:GNAT family N-acetyltransferase n=1 Tax=Salinispora arenicola TaxID=168697 RepID=UPI003F5CC409
MTHPNHRRTGITRALVEEVRRQGSLWGCQRLFLTSEPDNHAAHRAWLALGFNNVPGDTTSRACPCSTTTRGQGNTAPCMSDRSSPNLKQPALTVPKRVLHGADLGGAGSADEGWTFNVVGGDGRPGPGAAVRIRVERGRGRSRADPGLRGMGTSRHLPLAGSPCDSGSVATLMFGSLTRPSGRPDAAVERRYATTDRAGPA